MHIWYHYNVTKNHARMLPSQIIKSIQCPQLSSLYDTTLHTCHEYDTINLYLQVSWTGDAIVAAAFWGWDGTGLGFPSAGDNVPE